MSYKISGPTTEEVASMNGNTADVVLGTAPDSWGVWFPDDPKQLPWQRFLDEVVEAGYRYVELGPFGYLPTRTEELALELESRQLGLTAGGLMFALEQRALLDENHDELERVCQLLQHFGADFLLLIDDVYTDLFTGEQLAPSVLDDQQWHALIETTQRIAAAASQYGLRVVFHPHAQSHVETEEQITRFLDDTDGEADLCLDLGHHAYAGGDPVRFFAQHHARIPYLHLKSVDANIRAQVEANRTPFAEAVKRGVFVEPSRGAVDFEAFRNVLADVGYKGFAIVEQDMYPTLPEVPLPIAQRTRQYLELIGLG
jgi:inosose dehydratase